MGKLLKLCIPVAICGMLAITFSILLRDYPSKESVPALFLLVLVLVSCLAGRTAGLVTAILGGLIFATYLFPPYGSLAIRSVDDQITLIGFLIVALVLVRVSPIPQKTSR